MLDELITNLRDTLARLQGPDADKVDAQTLQTLYETLSSMPVPSDAKAREAFEDDFERHLSVRLILSTEVDAHRTSSCCSTCPTSLVSRSSWPLDWRSCPSDKSKSSELELTSCTLLHSRSTSVCRKATKSVQ